MTTNPHLVQVGLMGSLGLYQALEFVHLQRGTRVICRTERGLEVGTVISSLDQKESGDFAIAGHLLRRMTTEDELMVERLNRHRDKAFEACQRMLQQRGLNATLIDVEHLFDGSTVYFYFLGEVSAEVAELADHLAAEYESKVRFKKFAETLTNGCGPNCGSEESGCSSSGCGSCILASGCKTRA